MSKKLIQLLYIGQIRRNVDFIGIMFNKSILGKKDIKVKLKRLPEHEILKFMSVSLMYFAGGHKIMLLKFQTLMLRNRFEKLYFFSPMCDFLPEIFHISYSYYTGLLTFYYKM
jgi:hypothetical protein